VQPNYEIKFHPADLSQFGKSPEGLPLYRVVWADTRKTKLIYKGQMRTIPRYLDGEITGGKWILERLKNPKEFYGMSREQYDEMARQFPWAPSEEWSSNGEYDFEYAFDGEVDEVMLHKALAITEFRRTNLSLADKTAEAVAADELQEKRQDENFTNLYEEAREESLQ
jgi:hypothetical protein